jgi:hypothetical protein
VDDGDALPAVGHAWTGGPTRSLSQIFAAKNTNAPVPAAEPPAGPAIPADLQSIWDALIHRAKDQFGNAVYLPLVASQPRRDGDVLVIRLTGPFAHVGKTLEKYRDQLGAMVSEVVGSPLGIRLEVDATAPAPAAAPSPSTASPAPAAQSAAGRPARPVSSPTQQATLAPPPPREGILLTQELRQELEKDPLIRSLLVAFNGTIVKVEQK